MKNPKLLSNEKFQAFQQFIKIIGPSKCFLSWDGDTGEAQLCIPLGCAREKNAERRARSIIRQIDLEKVDTEIKLP